jgi:transposase/quinol monooxygenase YgiN
MIIRVFAARLKPGMRGAYERLSRERFIPVISARPGFLTYRIADQRPQRPDQFVLISIWKDLASLQACFGERWQQASIVPGEAELLEEVSVQHFDDSYAKLIEFWHAMSAAVRQGEAQATMAPLTDEQWERIRPLIPSARPGGRPRLDDRRTLDGILFVLRTGHPWRDIPPQYGSPVTCWRRFSEWEAEGSWEHIWRALLATLDTPGQLAWAQAFLNRQAVPTTRRQRRSRASVHDVSASGLG